MGGSISPGIEMRFKALNTFTQNLPLIDQITEIALTENTTKGGISSGVAEAYYHQVL